MVIFCVWTMEGFRWHNQGEVGEGGGSCWDCSSVGIAIVEYFSCMLWNTLITCDSLAHSQIKVYLMGTHNVKKAKNYLAECFCLVVLKWVQENACLMEGVLILVEENWICSFWWFEDFYFPSNSSVQNCTFHLEVQRPPSLHLLPIWWSSTAVLMVLACLSGGLFIHLGHGRNLSNWKWNMSQIKCFWDLS